jgi:hypothetical protein
MPSKNTEAEHGNPEPTNSSLHSSETLSFAWLAVNSKPV